MASLIVPTAAPAISSETLEKVLLQGDLERLAPGERLHYYNAVCQSLNLNPLTRPFDYITFKGKTVLYAKRECTEQLRRLYNVSVTIKSREITEGCYVVTACASLPDGRTDECIGAITLDNLKGEERANALMKAETKAKRRVTLAICGMAFLDETEVETIPSARVYDEMRHAADARQAERKAAEEAAHQAAAQVVPDKRPSYAVAQKIRDEAEPEYGAVPEDRPVFNDEPGLQPPHDVELEASLKAFPPKIPAKRKGKLTATEIEVRQWFGPLHQGYKDLGRESRYRDVLAKWGVEKCTGFKVSDGDPDDMAKAYTEALECRNYMQIDLQTLQAKQEPA